MSDEQNPEPVIPEPDRLPRQVRPVPHSLRLRVWRDGRVMHGAISGLVPAAVWQETLDAFYAQVGDDVSCLDVSGAVLACGELQLPSYPISDASFFLAFDGAQLQQLLPLCRAITTASNRMCVVFPQVHADVARRCCQGLANFLWPESPPPPAHKKAWSCRSKKSPSKGQGDKP